MMQKWPAFVISDLDGTLLSSADYSFEEARPALAELREMQVPVVLVSSKTRAEIEVIRHAMELDHPFVVENGGAGYLPCGYFPKERNKRDAEGRYEVIRWGTPYEELISALRAVRQETGAGIKGYSDVDVVEVARLTGLSGEEARRSMQRQFDEPFWVEGRDDERVREALELLEGRGLTVTRGGRFYHVMGACDKGRAVREILNLYHDEVGPRPSAGLGDAANDLPFLRVVDRPYIVAGPDGHHDTALVSSIAGAMRVGPAPGGWADAITDFLSWLHQEQAPGT